MPVCSNIVGIPKDCGDNNQGSIKRAALLDFEDLVSVTLTTGGTADTDNIASAITLEGGAAFEEFYFPKDTSSFTQELVQDLAADTHGFSQTLTLGFRRIDTRKRNAISLLCAGRRDLIALVEDWNGDWWLLGREQGLRVTASTMNTQEGRTAGQLAPITLTGEYEPTMLVQVQTAVAEALLA